MSCWILGVAGLIFMEFGYLAPLAMQFLGKSTSFRPVVMDTSAICCLLPIIFRIAFTF